MCLIGGSFCEQGKGVSGHCIPRTVAVCYFHLARYIRRTTNVLSSWDSWWLVKLNEAEGVIHPELRIDRIFVRSTVGIVSLVTPRDGLNAQEIRGWISGNRSDFFIFSRAPRPSLGPTHSPVQCVPEGLKRPQISGWFAFKWNWWSYVCTPPYFFLASSVSDSRVTLPFLLFGPV